MAETVDVAINVYGKPFETAVTLLSLLRHSGERVGKIYFIKEPRQPREEEFDFIYELLGDRLVLHIPKYWLWVNGYEPHRLGDEEYRLSIRYQLAWEKSSADYLYVTHNDVLYTGDIVGALLSEIGDYAGIGQVGQCWNCPAHAEKLCDGDRYLEYRPAYDEVIRLAHKHGSPRRVHYGNVITREEPWPLPECRLNEWVALINMRLARPETAPVGDAPPFGAMGLDIAVQWFRALSLKGYRFKNFDYNPFATHAWASSAGNGHSAMFNDNLYESGEAIARAKLVEEFGLPDASLPRTGRRGTGRRR